MRRCAVPAVAVAVMSLAGCGSSSDSSDGSGTDAGSTGSTATTVSIRDTGGGQVLATSSGHTLYVSDQEKDQVLCATSDCEAVWIPLTLPSGEQPSAPGDLAGQLTTVPRPDGSSQVALAGQPLYTFSFDRAAGDVNGDGESDSFDGVDFTWHAATPTGEAPATPSDTDTSAPDDDDGGYGY
jgi:predicted lipoprotein with Yx(FWY)xxD motif